MPRHNLEHGSKDDSPELVEQCFQSDSRELESFLDRAYDLSQEHFSNLIHFYVPSMVHYETSFYQATKANSFPGISVTGKFCALNCKHCNGQLLESMIAATTPEELFRVCAKIKDQAGTGCLVSGGSLSSGAVPLMKFIRTIKRVKQELGLDTVVHTGLVDRSLARALAHADIDAAMIDVIGSNDTLREIYHLNEDVRSFDRSLSLLEENCVPTVPHIVIGIHYGKLKGEKQALEMVSKHNPAAVVLVAFTPLSNTKMEHVSPTVPTDVARVVLASRFLMPETPLVLGCARPRGQYKAETDALAIRAGVNGIAYPSEDAYEFAGKLGLRIKFHEKCCSLLWRDIAVHTARMNA